MMAEFINNPPMSSGTISVPPYGSFVAETAYNPTEEAVTGWGRLDIPCEFNSLGIVCPQVVSTVTLKNRNSTRPDFEAIFPIRTADNHLGLMVDNRKDHQTVVMLANDSPYSSPISFTVSCRDYLGKQVVLDQITMGQNTSIIFNLQEKWPAVKDFLGVVEFRSSTTTIVLSAIRINPTNSFTPVLPFDY